MYVLLVSAVFFMAGSASAQLDSSGPSEQANKAQCNGLVGTWVGSDSTFNLGKDGTTTINGVRYRYTSDAKVITLVGSDGIFRFPYQLKGEVLNVLINGAVQSYRCAAPGTPAPKTSAQAGSGLSDELMVSSAWCTFSYNKITGYSNTTRWVFSSNGTYSKGGRGEGYSSGYGGSMASQHDSREGGHWKVVDGELYLGEGIPQPVKATVKRNSSGYPIVVVNGEEYSQCK
jgi:hypothetical protein